MEIRHTAEGHAYVDPDYVPEQIPQVERWVDAMRSEAGEAALELCEILSTSPNLIG